MDDLKKAATSALLFLASPLVFSATAVDDFRSIDVQLQSSVYLDAKINDDFDNNSVADFTSSDFELVQGEGSVVKDDGFFAFRPDPGFTGIAKIRYTIEDNDGPDQAIISINVQSNAPVFEAVRDTFYIPETMDNPDAVTLNVLFNDQLDYSNSDPETVDTTSGTSTEGGTVTKQDDSNVSYTPPSNFVGTDTFTYTISGASGSSQAEVTVYVGVEPGQDNSTPPSNLTAKEASIYAAIEEAVCEQNDNASSCNDITGLPSEQKKQLIQQASGRHTKLQSRTMRQMLELQTSNIGSRLREIRDERNQVSIDGLNLAIMGESVPLTQALQSNLRGGSAGDGELVSPWGGFINGNISIGKSKETDTRPSYDQDGYGLTLGVDYRYSDDLVLGAAAGLSKYDTDFTSIQGHQDAKSYSLISFGNYYPMDNLYIDGFALWTEGDLDINRRIDVSSVQQDLSSDTNSRQLTAATSVGYEFSYQRWQSTLYGRLEYSDLNIDGYTETGGSLALSVKEQKTHSLISALGTRLGYTFSWSRGVIVPSIELEYIKESNKDYNISNKFADAPTAGSFSINADEPDTEYMNLATSISAVFGGGNSAFLRYETLLLQDSYDFSSYSIGFRTEF